MSKNAKEWVLAFAITAFMVTVIIKTLGENGLYGYAIGMFVTFVVACWEAGQKEKGK